MGNYKVGRFLTEWVPECVWFNVPPYTV